VPSFADKRAAKLFHPPIRRKKAAYDEPEPDIQEEHHMEVIPEKPYNPPFEALIRK
jgi:hypothetical protein